MNSTLLNQYNLKFLKKKDQINRIQLNASGGGISEMLDDCLDPKMIEKFIQKVDLYASGGVDPEADNMLHAEIYTAYLDNQSADIYLNIGDSQLLQTIPLTDF